MGYGLGDWTRWKRGLDRGFGRIRRGLGYAGPDRDSLLLLGKSVLAATVAWLVADTVLQAPLATFAPFSALLMVQVTVAQSLYQSLRYVTAVLVGVCLAGGVIPLLGQQLWAFALLLLVATAIGRWPRLGSQGSQVAVAALFAYTAFANAGGTQGNQLLQLGSIAGLVVLGSAIGVLVNLVLVPPLRYRGAEYGVSVLAQSLCDLLSDVVRGIRDGIPDTDEARDWSARADRLPQSVRQARSVVEHAAETMKFNPRRLLLREDNTFDGYRTIVNALQRASEQLCSLTKGLYYATRQEQPDSTAERESFLRAYADVLAAVAEVARVLGQLHSSADIRDDEQLVASLRECDRMLEALTEEPDNRQLDGPTQWPVYGGLRTDLYRLAQEFSQAQRELEQIVRSWLETDRLAAHGKHGTVRGPGRRGR